MRGISAQTGECHSFWLFLCLPSFHISYMSIFTDNCEARIFHSRVYCHVFSLLVYLLERIKVLKDVGLPSYWQNKYSAADRFFYLGHCCEALGYSITRASCWIQYYIYHKTDYLIPYLNLQTWKTYIFNYHNLVKVFLIKGVWLTVLSYPKCLSQKRERERVERNFCVTILTLHCCLTATRKFPNPYPRIFLKCIWNSWFFYISLNLIFTILALERLRRMRFGIKYLSNWVFFLSLLFLLKYWINQLANFCLTCRALTQTFLWSFGPAWRGQKPPFLHSPQNCRKTDV